MAQWSVEGVNLYYEWFPGSSGKSIAFLNGVMASTNSWDLYVPLFRKLGYGVLLHDFRGQLRSDKPEGPYGFETHADDLACLAEHLGIEDMNIVGTSYGGEVALQFAVTYPEKTASLVIIDSVSEIDALLEAFIRSWKMLARRETAEFFYWTAIPSLYSTGFIAQHGQMLKERAAVFSELPEEYFAGQRALYNTFLAIHLTEDISAISCPTLIVCGDEDILKPPKFSRIIHERIKGSRLALLPNCGHVAIFEQPGLLKDLIAGFLLNL